MKRDDRSPKHYINSLDCDQRELLESIRALIFESIPGIKETIEYGMLGYPGLANLAAQKNYVALYVQPSVLDHFREEFSHINCGKSCLRFRNQKQLDNGSIKRLLTAVWESRQQDAT